jgi:hypothetical protein
MTLHFMGEFDHASGFPILRDLDQKVVGMGLGKTEDFKP